MRGLPRLLGNLYRQTCLRTGVTGTLMPMSLSSLGAQTLAAMRTFRASTGPWFVSTPFTRPFSTRIFVTSVFIDNLAPYFSACFANELVVSIESAYPDWGSYAN